MKEKKASPENLRKKTYNKPFVPLIEKIDKAVIVVFEHSVFSHTRDEVENPDEEYIKKSNFVFSLRELEKKKFRTVDMLLNIEHDVVKWSDVLRIFGKA